MIRAIETVRPSDPRAVALLLAAALLALAAGACAPAGEEAVTAPDPAPSSAADAQAYLIEHEERIDEILASMTLAEKVGQMTQADISFIEDPQDVARLFLGSVLAGGGSDPAAGNSPEAWREMVVGYHEIARSTRLGIPLIYGVDAVHGHNNVVGAVVFPHNVGLGATRSAELVEEIARATARATAATSIDWTFAPCVAVARDVRWGRTYESFAEDPDLVAELGAAAVRGYQGSDLAAPDTVVACAKHYVGDGGTAFGTGAPKGEVPDSVFAGTGEGAPPPAAVDRWPLDRGDTALTEEELRRLHLPGYLTAIEEGVATIMVSFSSWNGEKLSASRYLLTDVLKEELGFEGFLISDWAALDEIPGDYRSDVALSINAGMDMVMVPDKYEEFHSTLVSLVEDGTVPVERIDDAVRRILRVKLAAGLMEPGRSAADELVPLDAIGSAGHRELGRRAVRESLVLLENEGDLLPLAKDLGRIHVVGRHADDVGLQSGGWTIEWQGAAGEITEGTTILEGIRAAVADGTEVTYAADGSGGAGADVVIAVVGEAPYSEMMGDTADLALDDASRAVIAAARASGAPVVTVLVSGRPLIVDEALEASRAFVAAWLPGTEGAGVADVLFGDHAPTGKTPFTWPRSVDQLPLPADGRIEDPLFAYGFGLTY